jgi:hypothetical protein
LVRAEADDRHGWRETPAHDLHGLAAAGITGRWAAAEYPLRAKRDGSSRARSPSIGAELSRVGAPRAEPATPVSGACRRRRRSVASAWSDLHRRENHMLIDDMTREASLEFLALLRRRAAAGNLPDAHAKINWLSPARAIRRSWCLPPWQRRPPCH